MLLYALMVATDCRGFCMGWLISDVKIRLGKEREPMKRIK